MKPQHKLIMSLGGQVLPQFGLFVQGMNKELETLSIKLMQFSINDLSQWLSHDLETLEGEVAQILAGIGCEEVGFREIFAGELREYAQTRLFKSLDAVYESNNIPPEQAEQLIKKISRLDAKRVELAEINEQIQSNSLIEVLVLYSPELNVNYYLKDSQGKQDYATALKLLQTRLNEYNNVSELKLKTSKEYQNLHWLVWNYLNQESQTDDFASMVNAVEIIFLQKGDFN